MTRRVRHKEQITKDAEAVAEFIRLTGGQHLEVIARRFELGRDYLYQVLAIAPGITKFRVAHGATIWTTLPDARARSAAMHERRKISDAARRAKARAEAEPEDAPDWDITQSIIPAACAKPPHTRAVRWVFDLGMAA